MADVTGVKKFGKCEDSYSFNETHGVCIRCDYPETSKSNPNNEDRFKFNKCPFCPLEGYSYLCPKCNLCGFCFARSLKRLSCDYCSRDVNDEHVPLTCKYIGVPHVGIGCNGLFCL